jgi:putative transposase
VSEVSRRCAANGFVAPGRKSITARIRSRKAADVVARRCGRKASRDRYAPAVGSLEAGYPLALIQIDHTLVDVIVVDSETRAPVQRPWLTIAIDVHSRCVAGFHLSLEPPSATSVALCLTHAALPKDAWLAERQIESGWPMRGVPEHLHLDNAKEFRSEALRRGCEQYGIAIDYRPVRTPHYGGHIERLIGTMMGKVHLLPGTTFSNITERSDLDPEKSAAMTLAEVERWLGHAIAGVYHRELHRGLGMTPLEAWRRGIVGHGEMLGRGEPTAVADPRRFLIDFLPIERRLVRRDGVRLHGIGYWADVLSTWVGDPDRMIVRYDPRDLSRIHLLGPDGVYYDVSYRDLRRPPVSLWEHRIAVRRLREEGLAQVDEAAIFARRPNIPAI